MRIKKPHNKTNQDITFDTIEDRNEAVKTLFDGDIVKVLNASNDPEIKSGWAVYRFCFETQTFDLIEKEEKDPKTPAPNPDGATVERFTSDDKLRVIDGLQSTPHNATINEDFNLRVEWKSYIKQIKFITDNNKYLSVPCTQAAIEKTMAINGLNQSIKNWGDWLFNSVYYGAYVSKMVTDGTRHVRMIHGLGKFPTLNLTEDEVLVAMVRLEVPESFEAVDPTKLTFYRLWKKGLKAVKMPEVSTPIIIDNKTIVENQANQLSSFHDLNHGAGFEFPEHIKLNFDLINSPDLSFKWDGLNNGVDVFKYKNIQHPLGLRTARLSGDFLKTQCDTLGFTHYVRFSCFTGYTYWSSTWDYSSQLPSLEEFDKSGKNYLPIAICKLVFNPDYSLNLSETQISHIYRNGVLIEAEPTAPPAAETPDLQKVTDKGYRTTNRMVIRRDGVNSYGSAIEDETGSAKHSQNILGYAGHYELSGKDKSIGISLNGEGVADFKKSVSTAALKVKTGAAAGKIAICKDTEGNVIWGDMPKAELPPIEHNFPDGLSCDYTVTSEAKHKFSVPDAIKGFRSDIRLLKDFDFNVSFDYKTVKFNLVGANPTINIPANTKDGLQTLQISPLSLVMLTINQGKTIYIPVFKRLFPTVTGDAYYLGNASTVNGVQVFNDGTTETTQMLMQIKINVPTDWNNWAHSNVTVFKYWKKALGTFDELMDYRIANP